MAHLFDAPHCITSPHALNAALEAGRRMRQRHRPRWRFDWRLGKQAPTNAVMCRVALPFCRSWPSAACGCGGSV